MQDNSQRQTVQSRKLEYHFDKSKAKKVMDKYKNPKIERVDSENRAGVLKAYNSI